jgi:hypothetical protein
VDYQLLARESEDTLPEQAELIQEFTASSNGQVNLKIDLLQTGYAADPPTGPIDPRGKLISIYKPPATLGEQGEHVMSGWFYGDRANDAGHTKVKEQTELEPVDGTVPDPGNETLGSVSARYNMGPNGKGGLNLQLQNLEPDTIYTYEIHVDDGLNPNPVGTLTTNSGGNAKLSLRTDPGKGKGSGKANGHNNKGTLEGDPRHKVIDVKLDGTPVFSGPMLAQIPNLNDCGLGDEATTGLELEPGQPDVDVDVTTGVDESCGPIFGFAVGGTASVLPAVDYTMLVNGTEVGTPLEVSEDLSTGETFGELRFAVTPGPDELLLDFAVSGSVIQLKQAGTQTETPFLSVTLP